MLRLRATCEPCTRWVTGPQASASPASEQQREPRPAPSERHRHVESYNARRACVSSGAREIWRRSSARATSSYQRELRRASAARAPRRRAGRTARARAAVERVGAGAPVRARATRRRTRLTSPMPRREHGGTLEALRAAHRRLPALQARAGDRTQLVFGVGNPQAGWCSSARGPGATRTCRASRSSAARASCSPRSSPRA